MLTGTDFQRFTQVLVDGLLLMTVKMWFEKLNYC